MFFFVDVYRTSMFLIRGFDISIDANIEGSLTMFILHRFFWIDINIYVFLTSISPTKNRRE